MTWRPMLVTILLALALAGCAHVDEWATEMHHEPVGTESWQTVVIDSGDATDATVVPVSVEGPQAVADEDGPYLLDTGDRLRIFVYGQPNLSRLYAVDHGGAISMPLIGRVAARGLTTYALESRIKARLGAKYVKDPEVTVDVSQNRPFFILGEVRNAGQYPYVSGMTVRTAVAIAGGFSERAYQRKIQITRRINGVVEKLDVPDDYVVKPGDTLLVYERFL
ncbi:MAG: polysaccharide biosynthesis/export family protein [Hyphomicrobiaceae bacterium]|nr:polysaccharide biosynthesis/export family protein [Hyphomicrobiaceae bacterium]